MNEAKQYFERHRTAATRYAIDNGAEDPIFSPGSPSLESCLFQLKERGVPFIGNFSVYEDGFTETQLSAAEVNALIAAV